jgi:hypothetical protein
MSASLSSALAAGLTLANHQQIRNRRTPMNGPVQRFVIVDLRIPFIRLMLFFVKAALAAIPAAIIVGFIVMVLMAVIATIFGGTMGWWMNRWSM